jgi:hypothetical protein
MGVLRSLLIQGNEKLSQAIQHWDLPAGLTCPGKTDVCNDRCYAQRSRYNFPQVKERLKWCHTMSKRSDFAKLMVQEIRRKGAAFIVRVHCSGDFYDAAYVQKWIEVMRACPHTRFYGYTRSYRVPSILPALAEMAELDNMRLWFSADCESGYPTDLPPNVSVAWMQVDEDEDVPPVNLIFRDYPLRKVRSTRVSLSLVCPVETPQGKERHVNCGVCRRCWK